MENLQGAARSARAHHQCTAYRWLDEANGLVAWLVDLGPRGLLYGWRRTEAGANEAISFWARSMGHPLVTLHQQHPNEVGHAAH